MRCVKQSKAVRNLTKKTVTAKQIMDLALNSRKIFLTTFTYIIPYGDYYPKKQTIEIVEASDIKKNQKKKMIKLIELIPKRKSLLLAQKELKVRNFDEILLLFAKLNISPVTIPKSVKYKYLKSLYSFLDE